MAGKTFNSLTVLVRGTDYVCPANAKPVARYICRCNPCGSHILVRGKNLRDGRTKSCGCEQSRLGPEDMALLRQHEATSRPTSTHQAYDIG